MKKPKIKIETLPNGYSLEIEGKGYMYFNERELLTGILVHLGLREKEPMSDEELLTVLFDAMLGTEHAKKLAKIRSDISKLESDYRIRVELLDKTYKRVKDYEDMADGLHDRLGKVRQEVRDLEADFKAGKPMAQEILKSISSLNTMTYKLKEEMKESRALIRELKLLQHKENKDEDSAEKSKPKIRKSKSPDEQAAAYEKSKLRKRIQQGDATVFPDAGLIVHHTKKTKK